MTCEAHPRSGTGTKVSDLLKNPTTKLVLFLYDRKEARYSEILVHLGSRSTQTLAMKELEEEGLLKRRVVSDVRPTRAYYSLTEKGAKVAKSLSETLSLLNE